MSCQASSYDNFDGDRLTFFGDGYIGVRRIDDMSGYQLIYLVERKRGQGIADLSVVRDGLFHDMIKSRNAVTGNDAKLVLTQGINIPYFAPVGRARVRHVGLRNTII